MEIKEITHGFMNKTFSILTNRDSYILRIYESEKNIAKVRRESALLEYLSDCTLTFEVPTFLKHRTGDCIYPSPEGNIAIMMPVIKGENPDLSIPQQAFEAGKALGELNRVLSQVNPSLFEKVGNNPTYQQFRFFHPSIRNIEEVIEQLPTSTEKKRILHEIFRRLDEETPLYYPFLSKQYIHGDCTPGNLLSVDGKITGIIDFEFSCYDVRPMDLAIALGGGPKALWELDQDLINIGELTKGYVLMNPLTEQDISSIPFLIRLRRATMFVYFSARFKKGLDGEESIRGIVDWIIECENWLSEHNNRFLETVRRAAFLT